MAPYALTPKTWDGHDIQGMEYVSQFTENGETRNTLPGAAVEVSIPGATPKHVRVQPDGLRFDLELEIDDTYSQTRLDTLKSWFSPLLKGERELVATDGDNVDRVALCVCERLEIKESVQIFVAHMRNASGVWRAVGEDSDSQDVDAGTPGSDTWALTDKGSTPAPLGVTLTASAAKDAADSWPNRRRIAFANRAPEALGDRDVYAVKLCNLTDEGLTQISATWDHIRVLINSEFVDRWISDNDDLWINYRWQPRKVATLAENINDSVDELSTSNAGGFARDVWPDSQGFFFLDDEAIFYSAERTRAGLSGLIRGALGTTAASHTAGATLYWIEHLHIDILYGWTAAPDPQPDDDLKPLIDLEDSENDSHVYGAEGMTAPGTRRSMQFAKRSSDTGVGAQHTRQYASGADEVWENNLPEAGKPALNEASRLFPVPLAGPAEMDIDVGLPMLLRGFIEDTEGYESRLIDEPYTPTPLTAEAFALPANARKLRLVGGLGVVVGNLDDSFPGSWNARVGTTDDDYVGAFQDTAVRFTLTQDTKVDSINVSVSKAVGATGNLELVLMEDANGRPAVDNDTPGIIHEHVIASTNILEADLVDSTTPVKTQVSFGAPLYLPAGTYWLSFKRPAGLGSGLFYTGMGEGRGSFVSYLGASLQVGVSLTFSINSDETEPQDDAPVDGGETITVANAVFPLDATQAPKIVVGAEEDVYYLDATLSNAAGDYVSLRYPMKLDTELTFDTGTHRIIDAEYGLDVAFARQASSDEWPQAASVNEVLSWDEDGALITVATERRANYL